MRDRCIAQGQTKKYVHQEYITLHIQNLTATFRKKRAGEKIMKITNEHIYLTIAEEALDIMKKCSAKNRTPKPNGETGFIIKYDPRRTSFKNALIAIVFAANYLETIFYLEGTKRVGKSKYNKCIDSKSYEEKLEWFGIKDEQLISAANRLRTSRKEITHAKPTIDVRAAQDEAMAAVAFVKEVGQLLQKQQP